MSSELVNVAAEISSLREKLSSLPASGPILASSALQQQLRDLLEYHLGENISSRSPSPPTSMAHPPQANHTRPTVEYNVPLHGNRTLSKLYRYPRGALVEYPETSDEENRNRPVGHLFEIDPTNFYLPWRDFAYSRGLPSGSNKEGETTTISLLVDSETKIPVPCNVRHATCQGMKACPLADIAALQEPHVSATREQIQNRLSTERQQREDVKSPQRDVFLKTVAYINAIRTQGCAYRSPSSVEHPEEALAGLARHVPSSRRGYSGPETCEGRIIYHEVPEKKPYLSCEYFDLRYDVHHWVDYSVGNGQYDMEYIAAIFTDDAEEISRIETEAELDDYGPRAFCKTVVNYSNQRSSCPIDHRENDQLVRKDFCLLDCNVKYRLWFPIPEYRAACPFVLVTSAGTHRHPIPYPEKTPVPLRDAIFSLLESIREDLPDMTPRRFLAHPVLQAFLSQRLPTLHCPTLSALHPSLANRSHVGAYIEQAKKARFPEGTDWKGVLRLKRKQDTELAPEEHYIRVMVELDNQSLTHHEEDDPTDSSEPESKTRVIICMSREGSRRLSNAAYIQSDIGFQRIVGFQEFEMASMDRDANTSVIFCRVYLNRQTAAAHQFIFHEIERIVQLDTGRRLRWRHIDGNSLEDFEGMILQWGADQHRGQAKGLGLHLISVAASRARDRPDMHEPHRTLRDLDSYDHLRRLFRLCAVHFFRNIKTCAVPDAVRQLMRSLACIEHSNWDETISRIKNWVRDKETSRFAFPGLCQQKSFIPLAIWKAGEPHSNLVETVHRDINREGVHCTLLGGLLRGQRFDSLKAATLQQWEDHGIRPTYQPVNNAVNAIKNIKRQEKARQKVIAVKMAEVERHNEAMQQHHRDLESLLQECETLRTAISRPSVFSQGQVQGIPLLQEQLDIAQKKKDKLQRKYDAQVKVGVALREAKHTGVLLPPR